MSGMPSASKVSNAVMLSVRRVVEMTATATMAANSSTMLVLKARFMSIALQRRPWGNPRELGARFSLKNTRACARGAHCLRPGLYHRVMSATECNALHCKVACAAANARGGELAKRWHSHRGCGMRLSAALHGGRGVCNWSGCGMVCNGRLQGEE